MSEKHLHVISFDVPYPPDYGGVIDVYYKLKALKTIGTHIHLHCFTYGRPPSKILKHLCQTIHYYPRKVGLVSNLFLTPYIVQSRKSEALVKHLTRYPYPILMEGLHSTYAMADHRLKGLQKIYRVANIEHEYYWHCFKVETTLLKKLYFLLETIRLRRFQKQLQHADVILPISTSDTDDLRRHFSQKKILYLPPFHPNDQVITIPGKGDYGLYHGSLSVPENYQAARYLIQTIFSKSGQKLIIAGSNPPEALVKIIEEYPNVSLIANPDDNILFKLIQNAHMNILITFQATGFKLKLLNSLFIGRFCLVNNDMIKGTGLETLCLVGNDPEALRGHIERTFTRDFKASEIENRKDLLLKNHSNTLNAEKLSQYIVV